MRVGGKGSGARGGGLLSCSAEIPAPATGGKAGGEHLLRGERDEGAALLAPGRLEAR